MFSTCFSRSCFPLILLLALHNTLLLLALPLQSYSFPSSLCPLVLFILALPHSLLCHFLLPACSLPSFSPCLGSHSCPPPYICHLALLLHSLLPLSLRPLVNLPLVLLILILPLSLFPLVLMSDMKPSNI